MWQRLALTTRSLEDRGRGAGSAWGAQPPNRGMETPRVRGRRLSPKSSERGAACSGRSATNMCRSWLRCTCFARARGALGALVGCPWGRVSGHPRLFRRRGRGVVKSPRGRAVSDRAGCQASAGTPDPRRRQADHWPSVSLVSCDLSCANALWCCVHACA